MILFGVDCGSQCWNKHDAECYLSVVHVKEIFDGTLIFFSVGFDRFAWLSVCTACLVGFSLAYGNFSRTCFVNVRLMFCGWYIQGCVTACVGAYADDDVIF
jgi:uncharacterized membrane protein YqaE (UPF0057 family)